MEGHPEEDDDSKDSEERIDTLLDLGSPHLDLFLGNLLAILLYHSLGPWVREARLIHDEDHKRYKDHHDSCSEGIVEAPAEDIQIAIDKLSEVRVGLPR